LPPLAETVDVYAPETAELVVFEDGILAGLCPFPVVHAA
jgi:hypothetical protein